ncbi:MAG TPA: putative sulfate exporter family transporter [Bacteroidales bacterium]|nr:putative sulfate exporter family transporter [Bacteroidales bacterium]
MSKKNSISSVLYFIALVCCLFPFVSPPIALFAGFSFALIFGQVHPKLNKTFSKYLLQGSVVGLGFGMSLQQAYASGKDGMVFTILSVVGTLLLGVFLSKRLKVEERTGYLVSSGTAICGGSAIAAVGPLVKATDGQMSVALGTIFILNAIALFLFPILGHALGLSQQQFGLWSAIAIHDTSSVVGAASAYGEEALKVATTVKLTRALWIIPLSLVTSLIFKNKTEKIKIPWFILFFILAMVLNTVMELPSTLTEGIVFAAKKGLTLSLFCIGASLTKTVIRTVGARPMIHGVVLWIIISLASLAYIYFAATN